MLYAQRKGSVKGLRNYGSGKDQEALPSTYGICTRDRQGIYAVPEAGGVGAVECVVVSGKEVADSGSLSELNC